MQTRAQSTLEVCIDFVFSILVNVEGNSSSMHGGHHHTCDVLFESLLDPRVCPQICDAPLLEALTSPGTRQTRLIRRWRL